MSGPTFLARDEWRHSDKWIRRGKNYSVEVSRHCIAPPGDDCAEHYWCVYLYVYPKHPDFTRFDPSGNAWAQPNYDCHSYVSLFNIHRNNAGEIVSFQLGWDYNHDGDSYYLECATADDAGSVFFDASRLFDEAAARGVTP